MNKISTNSPKGTRDFLPVQTKRRQWIFDQLKSVFESHAYVPIETPAMENLSTLMGKYGEEGDRLIFKILNSGDYLRKADEQSLQAKDSNKLISSISEKALRYDLTVPFARYVVAHQNDLSFPFKRYQIQPVWRADRPQKGRYREFYQCDVDVIGSTGLWSEVELVGMIHKGFSKLGLEGVVVKVNHRKILAGMVEVIGKADMLIPITVAIDKIDKIGIEGVQKELLEKGLTENEIKMLKPMLEGNNDLSSMRDFLSSSEIGMEGLNELEFLLNNCAKLNFDLQVDCSLARGLNYYTGAILEVVHPDFPSSICGGGRYDDLTGIFGLPNVSGVGISFGADRIYDLLEAKNLFPSSLKESVDLLFLNMGDEEASLALQLSSELMDAGFSCMLYPDNKNFKKQMKYANELGVKKVLIIGTEELTNSEVSIKDMESGEQIRVSQKDLIKTLKS